MAMRRNFASALGKTAALSLASLALLPQAIYVEAALWRQLHVARTNSELLGDATRRSMSNCGSMQRSLVGQPAFLVSTCTRISDHAHSLSIFRSTTPLFSLNAVYRGQSRGNRDSSRGDRTGPFTYQRLLPSERRVLEKQRREGSISSEDRARLALAEKQERGLVRPSEFGASSRGPSRGGPRGTAWSERQQPRTARPKNDYPEWADGLREKETQQTDESAHDERSTSPRFTVRKREDMAEPDETFDAPMRTSPGDEGRARYERDAGYGRRDDWADGSRCAPRGLFLLHKRPEEMTAATHRAGTTAAAAAAAAAVATAIARGAATPGGAMLGRGTAAAENTTAAAEDTTAAAESTMTRHAIAAAPPATGIARGPGAASTAAGPARRPGLATSRVAKRTTTRSSSGWTRSRASRRRPCRRTGRCRPGGAGSGGYRCREGRRPVWGGWG